MNLPSRLHKPAKTTETESTRIPARELRTTKLPWILRIVYCGLGLGLIGLLVTARTLSPDPSGIGTHQQLGLPPCGFELVMGIPCPSCGMTTSWSLATRGRLIASAQSNLGGCLLVLSAFPAAIWLLATAYRGHWVVREPNPYMVSGFFAVVIVSATIQWAIRVQIF